MSLNGWSPPHLGEFFGPIYFVSLLVWVLSFVLTRRKIGLFEVMTYAVFGLMGLNTSRGIPWFGMVAAPSLALSMVALFPITSPPPENRWVINWSLVLLTTLLAVLSLPWFKQYLPFPPLKSGLIAHETPRAAAEFITQYQPGRPLFNSMSYGSYLIWAAQPDYPVFVDGRIELYTDQHWQEYLTSLIAVQPGWDEILEKYGFKTLMLDKHESLVLLLELKKDRNWEVAYEDDISVVLTKNMSMK